MTTMQVASYETRATRHIKSLREYIASLKDLGEIQEVDKEVDWNLEIGAITRRVYETDSPAPLFNNIKGHPKGFRVFGAPAAVSRQEGLYLARVALSLGLHPRATGQEMIQALAKARSRKGISPKRVETGSCKENIQLGDDVDLLQFPTPLIHNGDGGRYFNTWGTMVVQSPDKKWTNWSISRMMLLGKNKMTGIVDPHQHLGMIHKMWSDLGKPTPFALAQGCEPFVPFVCGMPLPAFVSEGDYAGAYFGESIDVVKCETSDLEVPASAEIVVEGTISNTERVLEGPMGEYAGYLWAGTAEHQPVLNVTAITYRNEPILPVVAAGEPVEEDHTCCGITGSAEMLFYLRGKGIPATMVWSPLATACHWWVVTVPVNYRETMNCTKEELCREIGKTALDTKLGSQIPKMMVIHDDIDPTNLQELVWGFATRCRPGEGEVLFHHAPVYPLIAFTTKSEKVTHDGTKSVYNCLGPEDWGDKLPERSSFRFAYPQDLQEKVLANWRSYGFAK
jgi:4-hydroxy-3-polyprenylbenzoate decarboxylase